MSKQVHCPECQSENTPGSKFCNSCGARLPKSTSVLCPKCQTPNPHSNFYCDNCGGRLHNTEQTSTPLEEESKPEASDLPTSAKMFSLPTRDPGDTGDLDPNKLTEWLKTQGEEPEKKENTGKLPRLSDLTPEERGTAEDLPGWLISTDSQELLIDSPDDITTEHFLHLIQDINEEEREKLSGLLSDPSIAGDVANLPDWLKDVAQTPQKETPPPPSLEQPEAKDDGDDWLFDSDTSDLKPDTDAPSKQKELGAEESDEIPDWLGELGPPSTALLGKSDEVGATAFEPIIEPEDDDLPDWLTEEVDTSKSAIESQTTEDIFSDAALLDNDVPDWMLGNESGEDSQEDDNSLPDNALDELTLDSSVATSLTGWLAEFDTDDTDGGVEETADTSEEPLAVDDDEPRRSLTDWLTAFDEDDIFPDDAPEEQEIDSQEPLPNWLTGIDDAVTAAAVETVSSDIPSEDDSFTDFAELSDDAPIADESLSESIDDSFDWLSDENSGAETSTDPKDENENLLESDVSADASLATGDTGLLPDWLDDLEPTAETSSQFGSGELDDTLADLFGETPKDATGELEWLEEFDDDEMEAEPASIDSSLAPLVGAIGAAAIIGASSQDEDDDTIDENPDWLSELASFDPNDVVESVDIETAVSDPSSESIQDETDFDIDAAFEATETADFDEFEIDDALLNVAGEPSGDWADIDGILSGTAEDEALPDWLEQLDDATDIEIADIEDSEAPPEEIPAWVANMRPGDTGQLSSVLPSALFSDADASELLNETGDLADAGLPDWLDDTIDQRSATVEKEPSGWFDSDVTDEDAPAELEALLADLPPAQAPEDMLQKAEIPDWLEELKPRELTGEAAPVLESRLESSGPLAGMPNTIAIEPIVAMPRAASQPGSYTISPDQVQQAILLRQIVQEGPHPPQADTTAISVRNLAGLRIFVAILLLVSVLLGLYGPAFLKSKDPAGVSVPAIAVNNAISNAAGKTVLIAFEYTPALSGELNHEAETLLTQLNAIGSPILTTSQYIAGTAVAETLTAPYNSMTLGLIPGDAIGLRQLGNCLGEKSQASTCATINNRALDDDTVNALADVGLIIVLTGERSSLVNWVEQVGTSSDIPIVIGATQSLEPLIVPYFATAQVKGYLNGLPATVAYQQAYIQMPDSPAAAQYGAHSLVLLVTAVILLIGGLLFGFKKKS